jgi:hypothetical protein
MEDARSLRPSLRPCTPPPDPVSNPPRASTPEPEAVRSKAFHICISQHSRTRTYTDFWLFSEEIQKVIEKKCILFHIRGYGERCMDAYTGSPARTVPMDQHTMSPATEDEIIVRTVIRTCPKQISIHPRFLVPWTPLVGSEVVITKGMWLGTVGLVKG